MNNKNQTDLTKMEWMESKEREIEREGWTSPPWSQFTKEIYESRGKKNANIHIYRYTIRYLTSRRRRKNKKLDSIAAAVFSLCLFDPFFIINVYRFKLWIRII